MPHTSGAMARRIAAAAVVVAFTLLAAPPRVMCEVAEVDANSFDAAVATAPSGELVLVEFYSPDCYHCQQLAPVLEELSEIMAGRVTVMKVDTRGAGRLARQYAVRSTPTMLVIRDGTEVKSARSALQGCDANPKFQTLNTGL